MVNETGDEPMDVGDEHDSEIEEDGEEEVPPEKQKAYVPGVSRPLRPNEEWDFDPAAYRMFHTFQTGAELPCLSFDVVRDALGENRETFPLECYLVGGTQAERPRDNQLVVMRLANMRAIDRPKTDEEEEEESSSSSSSEDEEEEAAPARGGAPKPLSARAAAKLPVLHAAVIPHFGDVNRIKAETIGSTSVAAVWNDENRVQIWNTTNALSRLVDLEGGPQTLRLTAEKPLFTFAGHSASGFALGWSPLRAGGLASGDNHKKIYNWSMTEAGKWLVDNRPLTGHDASVEDLQWSPTEEPLFVSCSADASIRLWDVRVPGTQACVHTVRDAHEGDVNVLSWNAHEPLIVSGGDDGRLKIWSLKTIQYNQSVATYRHHKKPITSVEWSAGNETTTFMAAGEDDQITIWDLALEADDQEAAVPAPGAKGDETKVPAQLLFVHMGATEIKEVHWHPQVTGLALSTAADGFHAFRTINV